MTDEKNLKEGNVSLESLWSQCDVYILVVLELLVLGHISWGYDYPLLTYILQVHRNGFLPEVVNK